MWGGQYHQQDRVYSMGRCALALPASIPEGSYKYMEIKQLGNIMPSRNRKNPNAGRVYDNKGLCPALGTMQGGADSQ